VYNVRAVHFHGPAWQTTGLTKTKAVWYVNRILGNPSQNTACILLSKDGEKDRVRWSRDSDDEWAQWVEKDYQWKPTF